MPKAWRRICSCTEPLQHFTWFILKWSDWVILVLEGNRPKSLQIFHTRWCLWNRQVKITSWMHSCQRCTRSTATEKSFIVIRSKMVYRYTSHRPPISRVCGKLQCLIGKSTVNEPFLTACSITRRYEYRSFMSFYSIVPYSGKWCQMNVMNVMSVPFCQIS